MRIRHAALAVILSLTPTLVDSQVAQHVPRSQGGAGKTNVAVLLYDGALLLDYAIAAEMFLAADFMRAFHVYTVARQREVDLIILGKARVDYTLSEAPAPDVVIVPGGSNWMREAGMAETASYLQGVLDSGSVLFSVCTGGLLLAQAGFLEGRTATTNHQAVKMLQELSPSTQVLADANFVDDGNVITAAGAGTAIEATLHVIERFTGREIAEDLAQRYLNYRLER